MLLPLFLLAVWNNVLHPREVRSLRQPKFSEWLIPLLELLLRLDYARGEPLAFGFGLVW